MPKPLRTFNCLDELARVNQSVHMALGVFDGLHLGHQAVIQRALDAAHLHGGLVGVLTFHPHPTKILRPDLTPLPSLSSLESLASNLRRMGVHVFVPLRFDATLAAQSALEFLERLLLANVKTIAVGEDWHFGRARAGNAAMLADHAASGRFCLSTVPPVNFHGHRISSTRIRHSIASGNLSAAREMLGRDYSIFSRVIPGAKLACTLGFPTANLSPGYLATPPDGVWVVRASDEAGHHWHGVANLGLRPTVQGKERLLETHLFDFTGDLYGKNLDVSFLHHLRPEILFPGLSELQQQIQSDLHAAHEWLASNHK